MSDEYSIIKALPEMLSGENLIKKLQILPDYSNKIRSENEAIRLMELSNIYNIYIPSQMSLEIYSKLYLALIRSLQKKNTITATIQQNQNFKAIKQKEYNSILGGSDSFTIIGTSGIGKSSFDNVSGNAKLFVAEYTDKGALVRILMSDDVEYGANDSIISDMNIGNVRNNGNYFKVFLVDSSNIIPLSYCKKIEF